MIGRLKGILVHKQPPWLVVDVHGVGYELEAPMSTFYDLPDVGREVAQAGALVAAPHAEVEDHVGAAPRLHYLRVTSAPHPGLSRRVESLVRGAGLDVQNRASRPDGARTHLGFVVAPADAERMRDLCDAVARLARVESHVCLGVHAWA